MNKLIQKLLPQMPTDFLKRAICVSFVLICGCKTLTPDQAQRVHNVAYAVTSLGTQTALAYNPTYRPAFELAYQNLDALIKSGGVNGAALREILASLPVKQLESQQGKLWIADGTFLFDAITGGTLNVENQFIDNAALGIRDGWKTVLGK